jgi:hypothetical protein
MKRRKTYYGYLINDTNSSMAKIIHGECMNGFTGIAKPSNMYLVNWGEFTQLGNKIVKQ